MFPMLIRESFSERLYGIEVSANFEVKIVDMRPSSIEPLSRTLPLQSSLCSKRDLYGTTDHSCFLEAL